MSYYQKQAILDFNAATRDRSNCGVGMVCNLRGIASHETLRQGLEASISLDPRAGKTPDLKMGDDGTMIGTSDGAGIITQIPYEILSSSYIRRDRPDVLVDKITGETKKPGVGVFFLPRDRERHEEEYKNIIQTICNDYGYKRHKWRETPINAEHLGEIAKNSHPRPKQLMILPQDAQNRDNFNHDLYVMRREIENEIWGKIKREGLSDEGRNNFHISSMSAYTMVHKSLSLAHRLEHLYPDLQNPKFVTSFVGIHNRFSTNTAPAWWRAHFKRMLAHNGEINTLKGNINAMYKLENIFGAFYGDKKDMILKNLLNVKGSDSDILDNAAEFLYFSGVSLPLLKSILIPPADRSGAPMIPGEKDMYKFLKTLSPGWEGPGMFVMTDGKMALIGGDLNGMRPTPYTIFGSVDNPDIPETLVVGSERGMVHNLMVPGANYSDLKRVGQMPGMKNASPALHKAYKKDLTKHKNKAREWAHKLTIHHDELSPGDMIGANFVEGNVVAGQKMSVGFLDKHTTKEIAVRDAERLFNYQQHITQIQKIEREWPSANDFAFGG